MLPLGGRPHDKSGDKADAGHIEQAKINLFNGRKNLPGPVGSGILALKTGALGLAAGFRKERQGSTPQPAPPRPPLLHLRRIDWQQWPGPKLRPAL